jgi:hypothetical protein
MWPFKANAIICSGNGCLFKAWEKLSCSNIEKIGFHFVFCDTFISLNVTLAGKKIIGGSDSINFEAFLSANLSEDKFWEDIYLPENTFTLLV